MYIQSIRLKNFGQFIDAEINFNYANDKPISLISGENASGKTILVNAIKWCFWGKEEFHDKNMLNDQVKKEMQLGDKCSAEIEIVFIFNNKIYTLKRENTYKLVEFKNLFSSQELSLSYVDKSGTKYVIENQNIQNELETILPSYLNELIFLTDSNYNFSKTTSNEIKFILELCEKYSLDGRKMMEDNINNYFYMVYPERNIKINIIENNINYSLPAEQAIFLAFVFRLSVRDILKHIKDNYDSKIELFPIVLDSIFGYFDSYNSEKILILFKKLSEQVIILSTEHCFNFDIKKRIIDYINTDFKLETIK